MKYKTYEIYNKWDSFGLLENTERISDQIRLALILEDSAKFLLSNYAPTTKTEWLAENCFLPVVIHIFNKYKNADYLHIFQSLRIFVCENKNLFLQEISGLDMEMEMCKIFKETYKPPFFSKGIFSLNI